jgi:hypothetical protein
MQKVNTIAFSSSSVEISGENNFTAVEPLQAAVEQVSSQIEVVGEDHCWTYQGLNNQHDGRALPSQSGFKDPVTISQTGYNIHIDAILEVGRS